MEEVHKRKEADRQADLDARLAAISDSGDEPRRGGEGDQDEDRDRHYGDEDIDVPVCTVYYSCISLRFQLLIFLH